MLNLPDSFPMAEHIKFPWSINQDSDEWLWSMSYIRRRYMYCEEIWKAPDKLRQIQIKGIVSYLLGSRNFALCLSVSPTYMRSLYPYIMASWVLTTKTRAEIAEISMIVSHIFDKNLDRLEAIEKADLLIIPYCEPNQAGLNHTRSQISNIIMTRKAQKKATLIDTWISGKHANPKNKDDLASIVKKTNVIQDLFGDLVFDMYRSGVGIKYIKITVDKEKEIVYDQLCKNRGRS